MIERTSRPAALAAGSLVAVALLLVAPGGVRAGVAALAGPVVSLGIVLGVVLWLGDEV